MTKTNTGTYTGSSTGTKDKGGGGYGLEHRRRGWVPPNHGNEDEEHGDGGRDVHPPTTKVRTDPGIDDHGRGRAQAPRMRTSAGSC